MGAVGLVRSEDEVARYSSAALDTRFADIPSSLDTCEGSVTRFVIALREQARYESVPTHSDCSASWRSLLRGGGCEGHPAAGRQAIGSLELTSHVALVREAGLGGGLRE